jgi:CRP-like cAMP-binding protein
VGNLQFDSVLARKLSTFLPLSRDELKSLAKMQSTPLNVRRGKQLTREGQTGHKVFVLQVGWACSYKDLPNGRRQIISFPIAGDCRCMPDFMYDRQSIIKGLGIRVTRQRCSKPPGH